MDQQANTIFRLMEMLSKNNESPTLTIESILPYLPEDKQWLLNTFMQMVSLCKAIQERPENTLTLIKPHMPPRTQRMIELFVMISEINNLLDELFPKSL